MSNVELLLYKGEVMQIYQCPNCGRTYTEFENVYYCGTCNYRLKRQEDIKEVKNPKLSERSYNVVGTISDPTKPSPKCPTCSSTNIKIISGTTKAISVAMFGFFSQKIKKQFHCNNCGYEW